MENKQQINCVKRKIRLKKKKEKVTDEEPEIKTRHTMAFP